MDYSQYKNTLDVEKHKLNHLLSKNLSISLLGLAISGGILIYDTARVLNIPFKLMEDSRVKEIYSKQKNIIYDAKQYKINQEKIKKIIEEEYVPKVEKSRDIENLAKTIAGASVAYFLLGCAIPLAFHKKKRKSLERELGDKG